MRKIFVILPALIISALIMVSCSSKSEATPNSQFAGADSAAMDSADNMKQTKPGARQTIAEDLIPVEVVTIKLGDISRYILLSSNLETEIMADVYGRMQGIVQKINKEEGQYVRRNEVMLELEPEQYELAEQRANVEYEKQLNNFNRLKAMHDKSLLSDEEFESAGFALETARIQWDEAKLNLDYMRIRAPISGWVGDRSAKRGERIQPTDRLFTVVNTEEMIAVVYVPEKNINQLQVNQKAVILSDNIPGEEFNGWVKRISPIVDPASGTFKVTIGVRNQNNLLKPGMFVNVRIIVDSHLNVVLVPKTAIIYENEFMHVYVVRDSVAHKIKLEVGYQDHDKVEAVKDINEGDKIIVVGQAGMKDKARVQIVSERKNTIAAKTQ
ncbi:MAG: efflux RND transporter periplasmic adaptor subunit [Calditrichaceae bacterium]|nr:efflux RND transporter periplasmic adaptor subunit [Calditrichaceae bacterium]MBN2709995.1 efflux RND transporter periplasmic adaptor subunit [Calditrichaceae bacterium]RQV97333.1 MAG: efflux RND transporter periplasmic adaptor subunit [Calditrichota bacterium]